MGINTETPPFPKHVDSDNPGEVQKKGGEAKQRTLTSRILTSSSFYECKDKMASVSSAKQRKGPVGKITNKEEEKLGFAFDSVTVWYKCKVCHGYLHSIPALMRHVSEEHGLDRITVPKNLPPGAKEGKIYHHYLPYDWGKGNLPYHWRNENTSTGNESSGVAPTPPPPSTQKNYDDSPSPCPQFRIRVKDLTDITEQSDEEIPQQTSSGENGSNRQADVVVDVAISRSIESPPDSGIMFDGGSEVIEDDVHHSTNVTVPVPDHTVILFPDRNDTIPLPLAVPLPDELNDTVPLPLAVPLPEPNDIVPPALAVPLPDRTVVLLPHRNNVETAQRQVINEDMTENVSDARQAPPLQLSPHIAAEGTKKNSSVICTQCNKMCSSQGALNFHMKKSHQKAADSNQAEKTKSDKVTITPNSRDSSTGALSDTPQSQGEESEDETNDTDTSVKRPNRRGRSLRRASLRKRRQKQSPSDNEWNEDESESNWGTRLRRNRRKPTGRPARFSSSSSDDNFIVSDSEDPYKRRKKRRLRSTSRRTLSTSSSSSSQKSGSSSSGSDSDSSSSSNSSSKSTSNSSRSSSSSSPEPDKSNDADAIETEDTVELSDSNKNESLEGTEETVEELPEVPDRPVLPNNGNISDSSSSSLFEVIETRKVKRKRKKKKPSDNATSDVEIAGKIKKLKMNDDTDKNEEPSGASSTVRTPTTNDDASQTNTVCSKCKLECNTASGLIVHLKEVHNTKTSIICGHCKRRFSNRYHFNNHIQAHMRENGYNSNI